MGGRAIATDETQTQRFLTQKQVADTLDGADGEEEAGRAMPEFYKYDRLNLSSFAQFSR